MSSALQESPLVDPPLWFVTLVVVAIAIYFAVIISKLSSNWRLSSDEQREIQIVLATIVVIATATAAAREFLELGLVSIGVGLLGYLPILLLQTARARELLDRAGDIDYRLWSWGLLFALSYLSYLIFHTVVSIRYALGPIVVITAAGMIYSLALRSDSDFSNAELVDN